ncbi:MAG: tRNA (guanosine(18)-2'-O)-methyltransferase TrmH [Cellvibrionaceae bacterium]|nr:tRNA (guanosine(18)-2'-O)-methyltransferase TrmH [Cellvibrionaceae bacterium]
MTPERLKRIRQVLNRRQPDLTIVADEVHKGRNLAAIVRSADAVGIDQVHTVSPKDGYRSFRGTASGSNKWVEVHTYDSVSEPIQALQAKGFVVLAAHLDQGAVDYRQLDYTRPTALLMGTERAGVSDEALGQVDARVVIPMMGMVESFNVSVAAAIILAEAQRQRQQAGLYDRCRLQPERYRYLFFRWAHPQVAQFCDARGLAYPALDEQGEIINGPAWYRQVAGL